MGALVVMVLLILVAIFADVIAPAPYDYSVLSRSQPVPESPHHLLGTDTVGRDFLSRLIYGARVSLIVGFSVQAIALLIGLPFGMLAGMFGGWVDYIIMRWVEVLTADPDLVVCPVSDLGLAHLDSAPGGGLINVIVAIGLIGWVDICRLTRAQLLSLREKEFVLAANAIGATPLAYRPAPPAAECPDPADRRGHTGRADGDLHRGRTELPGLWHQRPAAELG